MARYILIDRASGYVFGDTADIAGRTLALGTSDVDIIAACCAVDENVAHPRNYRVLSHSNPLALAANESGYLVYRADIDGSEAITVIEDGQDKEVIEAVERDCRFVAAVRIEDREEMTLEEFRASRKWSDDLALQLDDPALNWREEDEPAAEGWVYLDALWIQHRPAAGWENGAKGEWNLIIANCDWLSDDLADLEAKLYQFAISEGYTA